MRRRKFGAIKRETYRVYTLYKLSRIDVKFDKRTLISRVARIHDERRRRTEYRALSLLVDDEGIADEVTTKTISYHLYNKLLIGADVLSRAVRIVVLVLRVPYLARVRSLEGDSWTHKSQSYTRDTTGSIITRAIAEREIILAVLVGDNGGRSAAMAECPAGVSAKRIPLALEWPTVRKYRRETLNNGRTVIAAPRPIIFTVQVLLCHGDRSWY